LELPIAHETVVSQREDGDGFASGEPLTEQPVVAGVGALRGVAAPVLGHPHSERFCGLADVHHRAVADEGIQDVGPRRVFGQIEAEFGVVEGPVTCRVEADFKESVHAGLKVLRYSVYGGRAGRCIDRGHG
jgi:hypothetical protein